jgi:hypothetical protein
LITFIFHKISKQKMEINNNYQIKEEKEEEEEEVN